MIGKTYSATHIGVDGAVIGVEAAVYDKIPQIQITGLPGNVVKESRDRIRACLDNLGFEVPSGKVVVHLTPAHWKKEGSHLDLAIAISILRAENKLHGVDTSTFGFLGALGLDGLVHKVHGCLGLLEAMIKSPKLKYILVSKENIWEAGLFSSPKVFAVEHLCEAVAFCAEQRSLDPVPPTRAVSQRVCEASLDSIQGQNLAKRALQLSMAGAHHLLLVGPPGVGKSLIAHCAGSLLPPLDSREFFEVSKIHGRRASPIDRNVVRPFRSPHHSISASALLGGGSGVIQPGEISYAHRGVLFLDELPEFRRDAIEGLREPLEVGRINLHRVGQLVSLPSAITLISAMNPCPCGYSLDRSGRCRCSYEKIQAYRRRLSGPVLDRIDLCVIMSTPQKGAKFASHEQVFDSVVSGWKIQQERYQGEPGKKNAHASVLLNPSAFKLEALDQEWLEMQSEREGLSFRGIHKVLRVARTIADLGGSSPILKSHLLEAWGLRCPAIGSGSFSDW